MKKVAFCTILLTVAMFLAGVLPAVAAPLYYCKDLGKAKGAGNFFSTYAYGINASGQVVGYARTQEGDRAWLYSDGSMQVLGTLPAPYNASSRAYGINDAGQVAGYSASSSGESRAFLYSAGVMQDLGTLGGSSAATAINNAGQVAGRFVNSSGYDHAFLYSNNTMADLGTLPGGNDSSAYGINNAGQVVGVSGTSTTPYDYRYHAFLHSGAGMQDLGTLPGDSYSWAYAINNAGQSVGYSNSILPLINHAVMFSNGVQALGTLGGLNSYARGLNDVGQVVGYADTASDTRAFLYSAKGGMQDLTSLVQNLPSDVVALGNSFGVNNRGQIIAQAGSTSFLLTPVTSLPSVEILLLE